MLAKNVRHLIIVVLIVTITSFAYSGFKLYMYGRKRAIDMRCITNLSRFDRCLKLYILDLGDGLKYPYRDGAGLLTTLYQEQITFDPFLYICPGTTDKNGRGAYLDLVNGPEEKNNWVSYAGRKNYNPKVYPGIFLPNPYTANTTVAADDRQEERNHQDKNHIHFLFMDGHVDTFSADSSEADMFFDPLTN